MKTLQQHLVTYALYHRSRRNILTHFFGIPLIIFAILCLVARIQIPLAIFTVNGAHILVLVSTVYYMWMSLSLGLIMALILVLLSLFALLVAQNEFVVWLIISIISLIVGWVLQFIGHYYEGKKPAFVDDLMGLIIGPVFVLAEALFLFGFYAQLERKIISEAGAGKP